MFTPATTKKTKSADADQRLNDKFMESLALIVGKGCGRETPFLYFNISYNLDPFSNNMQNHIS